MPEKMKCLGGFSLIKITYRLIFLSVFSNKYAIQIFLITALNVGCGLEMSIYSFTQSNFINRRVECVPNSNSAIFVKIKISLLFDNLRICFFFLVLLL